MHFMEAVNLLLIFFLFNIRDNTPPPKNTSTVDGIHPYTHTHTQILPHSAPIRPIFEFLAYYLDISKTTYSIFLSSIIGTNQEDFIIESFLSPKTPCWFSTTATKQADQVGQGRANQRSGLSCKENRERAEWRCCQSILLVLV